MSAANPTPASPTADLDDYAKQEIRIAAVLNGGVSLAVWMSGWFVATAGRKADMQ